MIRTSMPSRSFSPIGEPRIDLGQVRSIGKTRIGSKIRFILIRANNCAWRCKHLLNGPITEETAVPQQQHVFLEESQQVVSHGDLAAGAWLDQGPPEHMGAVSHNAKTRACGNAPGARPLPGRPKTRSLAGVSGTIEDEAVHGHQTACRGRTLLGCRAWQAIG